MDKWVSNPNTVRVVALFLAIMLWAIVRYNNTATILPSKPMDDVPVQIVFNEEKYAAIGNYDVVQIQGKQVDLLKLKSSSFQVVADASKFGAGKHQVKLVIQDAPQGLNLKLVPEVLEVTLEKLRTSEFVVNTQLDGQVADGYTAVNPILDTKRVKVTGTNSQLKSIQMVAVNVNVSGEKETVVVKEAVRIIDSKGKEMDLRVEPSEVEVTVTVKELSKKIPLSVIIQNWPKSGFAVDQIELTPDQIDVFANQEQLKITNKYQLEPLNLTEVSESQFLQLTVPVYDGYRKVVPDRVEANVKIVPATNTSFSNLPIEIRGLPEGYRFEWVDVSVKDRMDVTLEGSARILDQMNTSDIRLFVDVSGLNEGTHQLQIQSQLPNWVHMLSNMPKVNVRLINE